VFGTPAETELDLQRGDIAFADVAARFCNREFIKFSIAAEILNG